MNIKHGFAALLGIMGLTMVGCVGGEVEESGAPASENVGEVDEAVQALGRINMYGQLNCWPGTGAFNLVPCGSGALFSRDDGRSYGSDVYYRIYTSTSCVTANANGTVTLAGCNISNNALPDENQRWLPIYDPIRDAYQLKNKLYVAYLRRSPYNTSLELFPNSDTTDSTQFWQYGKH